MSGRRLVATVVLPLVSAVAVSIYLQMIAPRLPLQVAIHWGPSGEADGFVLRGALPVLMAGLASVLTLLLSVVSRSAADSIAGRPILALPNGTVWFVGALMVIGALIQVGQPSPPPLPGWSVAAAALVGVIGGVIALVVAGPVAPIPELDGPVGGSEESRDRTVVWSGPTPSARAPLVIGVVVLMVGLMFGVFVELWLLALFAPTAALVAAASSYRVTVGPGEIVAAGRFLGYPRVRLPMSQVAGATTGSVQAWDFGGWGIRVGIGGETAVLTRSGPALVVERSDGAVLRISLDDPGEPAAVIREIVAQR